MKKNLLLDTDVVIDFLRGEEKAVSYFKKHSETVCFSAITVAEIYSGVKGKKEESAVESLFASFPVIDATSEISRMAGIIVKQYRASHSVEIPDAIIAATSLFSNAELKTFNIKHYPMFKKIKPPYKR